MCPYYDVVSLEIQRFEKSTTFGIVENRRLRFSYHLDLVVGKAQSSDLSQPSTAYPTDSEPKDVAMKRQHFRRDVFRRIGIRNSLSTRCKTRYTECRPIRRHSQDPFPASVDGLQASRENPELTFGCMQCAFGKQNTLIVLVFLRLIRFKYLWRLIGLSADCFRLHAFRH